jgi:methionyl-tRNA formyltransferase
MKILFIGGTRRGYEVLEAMIAKAYIPCAIISLKQFPDESDNCEQLVSEIAAKHEIALHECRTFGAKAVEFALKCEADLGIVVGARVVIPRSAFSSPTDGYWAVHDSLLPNLRGFAPLNWAILSGQKETGVSLFKITEGMDSGPVYIQKRLPIGDKETAPELYSRICRATVKVVLEGLESLALGPLKEVSQDGGAATYTCSRNSEDGELNWNLPAQELERQVRALTPPYPSAFTFLGMQKILVLQAEVVPQSRHYVGSIPGRVVEIDGDRVGVLTGEGVLALLAVAEEDGTPVAPSRLIKSVRSRLGLRPLDLWNRIRQLEQTIAELRAPHLERG